MDDYGWGSDDEIPVAELTDEATGRRTRPPRGRGPVSRRWAALALAAASVAGGAAVAARTVNRSDNGARRRVATATRRNAPIDRAQARVDVLAALQTTVAARSYRIHSTMVETSPDGTHPRPPVVADGTVNVDPPLTIATSNVAGLGRITAGIDGSDVWEHGGADYGMSTAAQPSPGAPLSQFAGLVAGSLGARAGAVAMQSMASPNGYLHVAAEAVGGASWLGDTVFGGVPVRMYAVDVDAAQLLERPGLTPEESKAGAAAWTEMRRQGYLTTTVRVFIDDRGFVRRTRTSVRFADGGTVDADVAFSDFGCFSVVMTPNGPEMGSHPAGCAGSP